MFRLCLAIIYIYFCPPITAQDTFISLSYHDCKELNSQSFVDTITSDEIAKQLQWLKENNYHPVSLDDILAAQKGKKALPENAILLTFDDGYESFYRVIYPLLKAYNFPAILAIVGKWIDTKAPNKVSYGDKLINRENFLTWEEIREINASGLVEIASHSYDHHHSVIANPQGSQQAAYTTRQYFPDKNRYETQAEYESRIDDDLKKNAHLLEKKLGKKPRIMVWPYGRYNADTIRLAQKNKMLYTITLDEQINSAHDLSNIGRYYYLRSRELSDFVTDIRGMREPKPLNSFRSIRVDMDYIYDPDPAQCEKNLGILLERIKKYNINTVFLQAYVDSDAKGYAKELYFPNRHLPLKSDLFSRVAWQLFTRGGVTVYAWMPLTAFDFKDDTLMVKSIDPNTKKITDSPNQYKRASIFSDLAKQKIREIYEDLAMHAAIGGIAFHDDGVLTDFEDASTAGIAAQIKAGFPASIIDIRQNKDLFQKWTRWKSKTLIDFSAELIQIIKKYHPTIKTTRSIFALPVLQPESEEWFAQNMNDFLQAYDFVAVMAMPYMEGHGDNPDEWFKKLIETVKAYPNGLNKTLFELQSVDWKDSNNPIDSEILLKQMRLLSSKGVRNFGYYPDDFVKNHPNIDIIKEGISVQRNPFN
jgi:biofilm PGA synthesis lipoprotein PgaB